jgi:hypothetical protein
MLASHLQGFCRDLHTECVAHILRTLAPTAVLLRLVQAEFIRGRQLDRGNAQPSSLGADFGRLGVELWTVLQNSMPEAATWRTDLEALNDWRNAIVHQDFTSARLGGIMNLSLAQVLQWRTSCGRFAQATDRVLRHHMHTLTGTLPW